LPMGMKLLILHPDDLFRSRLAERIRSENYKVFESSLEAEATEMIQQEKLDVILLGAAGANTNRLSFLKMIRKMQPFAEVILLTSAEEYSFDAAIKAMQLGAFDDLLLPIDIQVMICRIKDAFKRKREKAKIIRTERSIK
jgi:DNA-binding NtrC family response regulator